MTATLQQSTIDAYEIARVQHLMANPRAVFVFGSNRRGVHGAGAARTAAVEYGAVAGVGEGPMARAYAIPTKEHWRDRRGLPLHDIRESVRRFLEYARAHPMALFAVTRLGCGYAGYSDEQIAPLFIGAPDNVELPIGWTEIADIEGVWTPATLPGAALGQTTVAGPENPYWSVDADLRKLRLELREIRYRLMAVGALLSEPVSDKNLRQAKTLLEPVYHDAMSAFQADRLEEPSASTTQLDDDAARWRSVESAAMEWRDAEHYPTESPAQASALDRLTAAVDAAVATIKRAQEQT